MLRFVTPIVGVLATLAVAVFGVLQTGPAAAGADVFVVNSTASSGDGVCDATCTLGDAVMAVNGAGASVVEFDSSVFPPGSPATIALMAALPVIDASDPVTIDATGAGVIVDGSGLPAGTPGLAFESGGQDLEGLSLIGLTVRDFPGNGISICGGEAASCARNVTDVEVRDVEATGNGEDGVNLRGSLVSGAAFSDCTVSDNAVQGVFVSAGNNANNVTITDCEIDGNGDFGAYVESQEVIGNFLASGGSMSGNGNGGLLLDSVEETTNPVVDGVTASANGHLGMYFSAAQPLSGLQMTNNVVDDNGGEGNGLGAEVLALGISNATITGNSFSGNIGNAVLGLSIYAQFMRPSNLTITENVISDNEGTGLSILTDQDANNAIQPSLVAHNVISGNSKNGIEVFRSRLITISENSIYGNGQIGIDLRAPGVPPGVTDNDAGDVDIGANDLLNFPELTVSNGSAHGTACDGCLVEVFESDDDATGYGEGKRFIGSAVAAGGEFAVELCGLSAGDKVTATATDSQGNTSEFSENYPVSVSSPPCEGQLLQGDVDCDGDVDSVDALKVLQNSAGLGYSQNEPCPDIGAGAPPMGDVDCDGDVDAVDALQILRHVAGLQPSQGAGCTPIGEPV